MNHIQVDVTDQALITAICANTNEFFRHLSKSIPADPFENPKFTRWKTELQHPWFNGVLCSSTPEPEDEAVIQETIQYFRSKQVSAFSWWLEPHISSADWEPILSKYGFGFSNDTPGMAVDLHDLKEPTQQVDGLEIHIVADNEDLHKWAHVFTIGYGLPSAWETAVYDVSSKLGLGYPLRNYLGFLNGEPVATSCLFFAAGVAGVYSVATLPEARGKGIGAALTLRALHNARELGYRIGILQSSEMGFNIYKKLGFRHLCQIEYFYWRAL
jgi:GNAT superfamily N-acetyltransferase